MSHKLNFDPEFSSFLNEMRGLSRIVGVIEYARGQYLKKAGDFIKREPEDNDTISYIPKAKLTLEHSGFAEVKYRTKIKIGRFVTKFITSEAVRDFGIGNYDTEIFVNLFKSFFDRDDSRLKIVEGDEILKYYLGEEYYRPNGSCVGTLWNSCMRYAEKNKYMEIYSKNPNKIKMLVLFGEDNKVKTRALLWEDCETPEGEKYKVMDRIYSIFDHDMVLFKNWALKNGYVHKNDQSSRSENVFMTLNGAKYINLTTKLDNHEFKFYPYIDSFKYYSRKKGTLSNSPDFSYKYILIQNHGGLTPDTEDTSNDDHEYNDDYIMDEVTDNY
jgi:hypothetical protein